MSVGADYSARVMKARAAGEHLARALGLPVAFSEQQMWRYARLGLLPSVRIGRTVWFDIDAINAYIRPSLRGRCGRSAEL